MKIISFGPRPLELSLPATRPSNSCTIWAWRLRKIQSWICSRRLTSTRDDPRIAEVAADMAKELGDGNKKPEILPKLAQYELTLLDWIEEHRGYRKYVAIAGKCWPAFQTQFGFVPCYVNSRLTGRGIPVSCEVDIYGCLSEFIGTCVSDDIVTLLDINNTVPYDLYNEDIKDKYDYSSTDVFMGFHCGNTSSKKLTSCPDEISADYGEKSAGGGYPGNPGGRYRSGRYYLLPSAEYRRQHSPGLCGQRRGPSGGDPILWRNRHLRDSGDEGASTAMY